MRFRILGPLSVEVAGAPLRIRSARVSTLLATLLLEANRTVPTDRLIEAVWGWHAPPTARAQLTIVVSQLRRLLAQAGVARPVVFTETAGYRLAATTDELDALLFERYVADAERAASTGRPAEAVRWFNSALGLWRGPALAGVPGQLVGTAGTLLTERRAAIRARRIALELALGRHADLVTELVGLAAADPFNERFREDLVLALYRSGRVTEALAAYQDFRQRLADEVGIEPAPRLAVLHRRILNRDPALDLPATAPAAPSRTAPTPAPSTDLASAPVPNRTEAAPGDPPGTAVESGGTESNRPGRRPGGPPARRRLVGRPGRRPAGMPGRRPGGQPGGPARRRPSGRDGTTEQPAGQTGDTPGAAWTLPARPEPPTATAPAIAPVTAAPPVPAPTVPETFVAGASVVGASVVGASVVGASVVGAVAVGRSDGELPARPWQLPLAVGADRSLAQAVERLTDGTRRLDRPADGDRDVRRGLAGAYQRLVGCPAVLLRRLGTLPVAEFPGWLAGPLLDTDRSTAEQALAELTDAGLVQPVPDRRTGLPRYRMPELVRLYARERVGFDDPPPIRATAHRRAYWWLLDLALRADRQLPDQVFPAGALGLPQGFGPDAELLRAVDTDPLGWLSAERHLVVGAAGQAGGLGDTELAWRLAVAPTNFLHQRGLTELWQRAVEHGRAAVRGRGGADRAQALLSLGNALLLLSRAESAAAWTAARTARRLFDELGDPDRAAACATVQWLAGQRPGPAANPLGERVGARRGTDEPAPLRTAGTLRGVIRRIGVAPRATPILCPADPPEPPPRRTAAGLPAPRRASPPYSPSVQQPPEVVAVFPGQVRPPDPALSRGE
ncbi:hypothetical protein GCM10022225_11970 [Plantactinospora mayteni]|nr:AfsR/SARP family transcriptional regulator [Plantactinospora mayteni]